MKLQSIATITPDRPSARARKPSLTYYRYDEFGKKVDFEGGRASGIYDTYYKFARKVQFRGGVKVDKSPVELGSIEGKLQS